MDTMVNKGFDYYNGENFIYFDIVDIKPEKRIVTLAVSNLGKISILEYDLYDDFGDYFFIYGRERKHIYLNDFETIEE